MTTEYVGLQRRNWLHGANSCCHSPPTSNAQPLPQILSKLLQGQQQNTPRRNPRNMEILGKKSIHPSSQFFYRSRISFC